MLGIGSRVKHPELGDGVVVNHSYTHYKISFIEHGMREIPVDFEFTSTKDEGLDDDLVSFYEVERVLRNILNQYGFTHEDVKMADKFKGGTIIIQPKDKTISNKEIPMDTFFNKIIMLRDRLRVMEQKINASNLEQEEKISIQQYITKCYGSLTTFNILFRDKDQHFVGEKS